jgi:hypothetical protein
MAPACRNPPSRRVVNLGNIEPVKIVDLVIPHLDSAVSVPKREFPRPTAMPTAWKPLHVTADGSEQVAHLFGCGVRAGCEHGDSLCSCRAMVRVGSGHSHDICIFIDEQAQ